MWRSPATFSGILGTCGIVCFLMRHVDGAAMLGTVLLLVGIGMPVFYLLSFAASLFLQIRKQKLPRMVYTLTLTNTKEFHIENEAEKVDYPWKKVHHVYRGKTATYLYATPARAFILPHYFVEEGTEELWKLISKKHTVPDRCLHSTDPGPFFIFSRPNLSVSAVTVSHRQL